MEASIKEGNIRNFVRFLQCAAKFGDDLNMHANKDLWELSVTNSSKSAYCLFKLRPSFFSRWPDLKKTTVQQRRGIKCQLLVKSLLAVLAKSSSQNTVQRLDLTIVDPEGSLKERKRKRRRRTQSESQGGSRGSGAAEEDEYEESEDGEGAGDGGREARLMVKLVCRHGVTKKHSLHLASSPFLRATVDPRSTPSGFTLPARTLRDWLDHFSATTTGNSNSTSTSLNENQLGWQFTQEKIRIKSFEMGNKDLSTEVVVDAGEFGEGEYEVVDGKAELTVPMKEFRATLMLAEQLAIDLTVAFSEASQPLTLTSEMDEGEAADPFSIFCAIATTSADGLFKDGPGEIKPKPSSSGNSTVVKRQSSDITSLEGDGQNGRKKRRMSEVPGSGSSRRKERLNFSDGSGNQGTAILNSVPTPREPDAEQQEDYDDGGRLFLPGGSQQLSGSQQDGMAAGSQSGARHLTQKEVLEMSGMGDLDPHELMDALDEAEEEDEREEEEEMLRASQMQGEDVVELQVKLDKGKGKQKDVDVMESGRGEMSMFEPDDTIDWKTSIPRQSIREAQRPPEEMRHGRGDTEGIGDGTDELDEDDEDVEMPPTQRTKSQSEFPSFFGDSDEIGDGDGDEEDSKKR